jgi:nucleoside-diphosphate-sugar epimerase
MRVVVIGGAGKIGLWVVRELLDASAGRAAHEVTVFDRVAGPATSGVRYLTGDHRDLGQVLGAVAGADVVVHLAAVFRQATPDTIFHNNVLGTFNVHEAAWRLGVRRVVSTSTRAALGWTYAEREFPPEYFPIDEAHPLKPQDPYGLSKKAGEAIARSYTAKCGMETVVLRPSGVMSPAEMAQLRASGGRPARRFDTFTYVDVRDLATAYRLAVERPLDGHTVLWIVADDSMTSEPLGEAYARLMPSVADMARVLTGDRPAISNARAKAVLGWRPLRSWRRGETPEAAYEREPAASDGT